MSPAGSGERLSPQRLDVPGSDALAGRLFPPLPREVEWGLDRVRDALRDIDDPHLAAPSLHVGGTNGKGSVAAVWASVLGVAGRRVGLYTSPHLCSFRERYRVAGRSLDPETLLEAAGELRDVVTRHGLTFFEAATVLAFHVFRRQAVDVVVAEVGLGGRLDATNVLEPEVTAVTNVALDHADFLGSDLSGIAREKAGIAKAGVPFVTAEGRSGLLAVLREEADAVGAPFHPVAVGRDVRDVSTSLEGSRLGVATDAWGDLALDTPLVGRHQAVNVGLAVRCLELLPVGRRPGPAAVRRGVREVRWPGRLQVERRRGRTWILDVAHNPAGVEALARTLGELAPPRPWSLVVGILGDKDWRVMLPPLFRPVDRAFLTQAPTVPAHRRWDPAEALRAVERSAPAEVVPDLEEALGRAEEASSPGGTVVVTGSHYTVGSALRALGFDPDDAGS